MLTEKQKKLLENTVYQLLKESVFEDMFGEKKHETNKHDDKKHEKKDDENTTSKDAKRASVIKWLDGDQVDLAPLAYELAKKIDGETHPDETEKGTIRSEFYKKVTGKDSSDRPYHFNDDEINMLYNMKDDYIQSID